MIRGKNITAIIQARVDSTRLPNKVLAEIEGKPMLWHVVNRVGKSSLINQTIVAIPKDAANDRLAEFCESHNIQYFRGSNDDVLDRYCQAAKFYKSDVIVRITADCPLIDPEVIDKVVTVFLKNDYDYVCNTLPPTYPDGLDTEVIDRNALNVAWRNAELKSEREHVTPYILNNPDLFRIKDVRHDIDLSNLRWTVDEPEDLEYIRNVYRKLGPSSYNMADVLKVLEDNPEFSKANQGIERNEGYAKSLREGKQTKLHQEND
ncbi:MAG: glycosyltransferase family protein [Candidatus Hatepunaea meridiana]|nr:glycosyltransferase family protein [Candidatus Hatepunaea meridiana]